MKKKIQSKYYKRGRLKGSKKKFDITFEILPPGTLHRNSSENSDSPSERWEEITDICAKIIARNIKKK
ncbi:hypothetical protein JXC34_01190 [Candidatus Woesearchaeota archaeon]|nr:hypothetical protein [Candidatus Woesearchaeota archaeon]